MNISHKASFPALAALAALAALGSGASPARADTLVTVDFPGATLTKGLSVNDSGNLVGLFNDSTGATKAYERLSTGTFSAAIVEPGDNQSYTRALGINNAGTIVGDYLNLDSRGTHTYHGYFLKGSTFTTFDVGGPFSTTTAAINNAGDSRGFTAAACRRTRPSSTWAAFSRRSMARQAIRGRMRPA